MTGLLFKYFHHLSSTFFNICFGFPQCEWHHMVLVRETEFFSLYWEAEEPKAGTSIQQNKKNTAQNPVTVWVGVSKTCWLILLAEDVQLKGEAGMRRRVRSFPKALLEAPAWKKHQQKAQSRHAIVRGKKEFGDEGVIHAGKSKLAATLLSLVCMSVSMVLERSLQCKADS